MSQGTKTYLIIAGAAFALYYASGFVQDYCHDSGATTRFCRRMHLSSAPAPVQPQVSATPKASPAAVDHGDELYNNIAKQFPIGSSEADLLAALAEHHYVDTNDHTANSHCQNPRAFTTGLKHVADWTAAEYFISWCSDANGKITWIGLGGSSVRGTPIAPAAGQTLSLPVTPETPANDHLKAETTSDNRPVMPDANPPAPAPDAIPSPSSQPAPPAKPASRLLVLGDVMYKSPSDWTIWLDGKPVTPAAKPKELIEISVAPTSVRLKWFDMDSSQLIDATLPPHAAYDMDRHVVVPAPASK